MLICWIKQHTYCYFCIRALQLECVHPKARHRRAIALRGLKRFREAVDDLEAVLSSLEPRHSNKVQIEKEIYALKEQLAEQGSPLPQAQELGKSPTVKGEETSKLKSLDSAESTVTALDQKDGPALEDHRIPVSSSHDDQAPNDEGQGASVLTCSELRAQGNKSFKEGNLEQAKLLYSHSIAAARDDEAAASLANRAQVFLDLHRYEDALADCNACLSLNKSYLKAQHRRAVALKSLGRLSEAVEQYAVLIESHPKDKTFRSEYCEVLAQVGQEMELGNGKFAAIEEEEVGNDLDAGDESSSTKVQWHQIVIQETDSTDSEDEESIATQNSSTNSTFTAARKDNELVNGPSLVSPTCASDSQSDACFGENQATEGNYRFATGGKEGAEQLGRVQCSETSAEEGPLTSVHELNNEPLPRQQSNGGATSAHSCGSAAANGLHTAGGLQQSINCRNSSEFSRAVKKLGRDAEAIACFVKDIGVASYASLFGSTLMPGSLSTFIQAWERFVDLDPDFVEASMLGMVQVERFAMILILIRGSDAQSLSAILSTLERRGRKVDSLRAMYKL